DQYYGWGWPRTKKSGRLETGRGAFAKMANKLGHGPDSPLRRFQRLHDRIGELRLNKLVETVAGDGCARVSVMPYWTRTSRNQPMGRTRAPSIFSLPEWTPGFIKPPPGFEIRGLDYSAQEVGLGAGLPGDLGMIEDSRRDPHIGFAIRCGLAPAG